MKKSISEKHRARKQKMQKRCCPKRRDSGQPQLSSAGSSFELGDRIQGISSGGVPLIHKMCDQLGLKESIDGAVHVLKQHQPYYESDHVLNIAFNILAGGTRIEHIENRRRDVAYLDALGTHSLPDPTTSGDFCRRFTNKQSIDEMQDAFNQVRLRVWSQQESDFFNQAIIEADGTICPTQGECKEGMDISYDGVWGYHPLVVSLANTAEPLYLLNRSGNRPSHEGAAEYFDKAGQLCRGAGFRSIHFRGDTDFSQTTRLDGWDRDGITFTFGMDKRKNLVASAENLPSSAWEELMRAPNASSRSSSRAKPENTKEQVIERRGFRHIRLTREDVAEIPYRPIACAKNYRLIILKKTIHVTQGLFENLEWETRYFFYLSNRTDLSPSGIVHDARKRCDQENLNAHLKNGVHALSMPLNSLHANWAYAAMAALAWSMKAWAALLLPANGRWAVDHREDKRQLLRMEFHTFRQALMNIPAQIARSGRRLIIRLINWNEWTPAFFRLANLLAIPIRV